MEEHLLSDTGIGSSNRAEDDQLATFMSHDPTYFVFRRFHALNLRNLLHLQAKVLFLEQQIERIKAQSPPVQDAKHCEQLMLAVDEALHRYSLYPISPTALDP
jgi:hypothetical protein